MAIPYTKIVPIDSGPPNKIKGWKPVEFIPFGEAVYCADCDGMTGSKNGHCEKCGLHAIVHADKFLRGELVTTPLDWWVREAGRGANAAKRAGR